MKRLQNEPQGDPEPEIAKTLQYLLQAVRGLPYPDAEDAVMKAVERAIVSFNPAFARSLASWISMKADYELRNIAALCPRRTARDAYDQFVLKFGYEPSFLEFWRYSGLTRRQIGNVIWDVVGSADGPPGGRRTLASAEEILGLAPNDGDKHNSLDFRDTVNQVLLRLSPTDALLLILKHMCLCTEREILGFISTASWVFRRTRCADHIDAMADAFVADCLPEIRVPWDVDLFKITSRRQLAVRLFRARQRFRDVHFRLKRRN